MAGWKGQTAMSTEVKVSLWMAFRGAAVQFWTLLPQFIGGFLGLWLLYLLAMWITSLIGGG